MQRIAVRFKRTGGFSVLFSTRFHNVINMKVYLLKKSFFSFRGTVSYEVDILDKTAIELMSESLHAIVAECGELPEEEGERVLLYPVYPFLTAEALRAFCAKREGSFAFEGGFVLRGKSSELSSLPVSSADSSFGETLFTLEDYARVLRRAASERVKYHLSRGVLAEEGAEIGYHVVIGKGAKICRGARISGASEIGENAEIGDGCEICDSAVGEWTKVRASTLLEARVGKNCTVGPNAYLRPFSEIGDDCRIGDFVEIKNANIGNGSKISHLAYVGDADVGKNVNVGCGVVFVNYSGRKKSRTTIGDGCFVGSNCNLIAPVRMEQGSYLAAGTTLTKNLTEGDFCVGRCRETIKPNRAQEYFPRKP